MKKKIAIKHMNTLNQIDELQQQLDRLKKLALEQEAKKRLETLKKEPIKKEPVIRIYTTIIQVCNRPRLPYYPDVRPYRIVPMGTPLGQIDNRNLFIRTYFF